MKVLVLIALMTLPALAEDWTVNGKDYNDVKVLKVEDDMVSVQYTGGIGRFAIADLSPELKKRFNYDPAKAAAIAKQKADEEALALEAEKKADEEKSKLAELKKHEVSCMVEVVQVLPDGILADKMQAHRHIIADSMASVGGGGNSASYYDYTSSGNAIFIENVPSGLTENQQLRLGLVRNGTFTYTDVDQISHTIEKWTCIEAPKNPSASN